MPKLFSANISEPSCQCPHASGGKALKPISDIPNQLVSANPRHCCYIIHFAVRLSFHSFFAMLGKCWHYFSVYFVYRLFMYEDFVMYTYVTFGKHYLSVFKNHVKSSDFTGRIIGGHSNAPSRALVVGRTLFDLLSDERCSWYCRAYERSFTIYSLSIQTKM